MNKFLRFIAAHAIMSATAFAAILILLGFGLLFRPHWILQILRYGLAIGNIGGGLVILVQSLMKAIGVKKTHER